MAGEFVADVPVIEEFLGPLGPTSGMLRRQGEKVAVVARRNASGAVLNVVSGKLLGLIETRLVIESMTPNGYYIRVGSTATRPPSKNTGEFSYPGYWNAVGRNGISWLGEAASEVFGPGRTV